jgi:mono/diheme cytochrome c family protein
VILKMIEYRSIHDCRTLTRLVRMPGVRAAALVAVTAVWGCDRATERFEVNRVFARNQKLAKNLQEFATPQVSRRLEDVDRVVTRYFGTPGEPLLPTVEGLDFSSLFAISNLQWAAGSASRDARGTVPGLYRSLCARCHGVSGNGCGPAARGLNPYPRDYRRGIFKFKRTPLTLPPAADDLRATLMRGVPETAMPSFRSLTQAEREALVQYVRYLSIRGLFERAVITEIAVQFDDDERLLDPQQKEISPTAYARQVEMLDAILVDVVQPWLDAPAQVTVVPPPPVDYDTPKSIARGRELFYTTLTNCGKCHGDTAMGDGQTEDYDEWTKEVEPTSPEALVDYLALGALPPRYAEPRTLRLGVYRGGDRPEDLFVKIKNGMAGTTMTSVATQLRDDDIWHLVAYARYLPFDPLSVRDVERTSFRSQAGPDP